MDDHLDRVERTRDALIAKGADPGIVDRAIEYLRRMDLEELQATGDLVALELAWGIAAEELDE